MAKSASKESHAIAGIWVAFFAEPEQIFRTGRWGVPINETFLPQNMKDAGYHTAMFGAIL